MNVPNYSSYHFKVEVTTNSSKPVGIKLGFSIAHHLGISKSIHSLHAMARYEVIFAALILALMYGLIILDLLPRYGYAQWLHFVFHLQFNTFRIRHSDNILVHWRQ